MAEKHKMYGIHAVQAALVHRPESIVQLWFSEDRKDQRLQQLVQLATQLGLRPQFISGKKLQDLADSAFHQGVVAEYRPQKPWDEAKLHAFLQDCQSQKKPILLLVLEGIQDPHNLGACLRTAEAMGVSAVVIQQERAASLSPVVRKVASGATESLPIAMVSNIRHCLERLKPLGIWVHGAAAEAEHSILKTDLRGDIALVMGTEGKGLKKHTESGCDVLFSIPMQGQVSSLNVSVATGICLYEACRQRGL